MSPFYSKEHPHLRALEDTQTWQIHHLGHCSRDISIRFPPCMSFWKETELFMGKYDISVYMGGPAMRKHGKEHLQHLLAGSWQHCGSHGRQPSGWSGSWLGCAERSLHAGRWGGRPPLGCPNSVAWVEPLRFQSGWCLWAIVFSPI